MELDENKRWKCNNCGVITFETKLLRISSPFDIDDILVACPQCKFINDFYEICDEPGCVEEACCGFPDDILGGYRRTCYKHYRA